MAISTAIKIWNVQPWIDFAEKHLDLTLEKEFDFDRNHEFDEAKMDFVEVDPDPFSFPEDWISLDEERGIEICLKNLARYSIAGEPNSISSAESLASLLSFDQREIECKAQKILRSKDFQSQMQNKFDRYQHRKAELNEEFSMIAKKASEFFGVTFSWEFCAERYDPMEGETLSETREIEISESIEGIRLIPIA